MKASLIPMLSCAGILAAALGSAQTKDTKVDVSTKGVSVKRTTRTKTTTRTTKVNAGLGGVSAQRTQNESQSSRDRMIKVVLNGTPIDFADQGPVMMNNSVLVPMRGVFEKMGATLSWDPESRTVVGMKGDQKVTLIVGNKSATVGDRQVEMTQPAVVMNGRTLVPLRFLSESLGATVDWNASDMTVAIKGS